MTAVTRARIVLIAALLAPSLIAMSLVLTAFAGSPGHPLAVVRPLIASFALGAAVCFACVGIVRRPIAAAAATLAVIGLSGSLVLIVIMVLVWVTWDRWHVIHGRPAPAMTWGALAGGASALFIAGLLTAVMAHGFDPRDWTDRGPLQASNGQPSIYVLLLDGYPGVESLEEIYGFDNEPFLSALGDLGFIVDRESRSSHYATELTLLDMLSGHSTVTEVDLFGAGSLPAHREARRALRSAPGTQDLSAAGYELVNLTSPIDGVELDTWDRLVSNGHLSDFEIAILAESPFGQVLGDLIMEDLRARVDDQLSDLASLADPSAQRVVLAHLMAPHPPFLWGEEGVDAKPPACWPQACRLFTSTMDSLHLSRDAYVQAMRAQVLQLNILVETSLRTVIERDPDGIVVVMSDHGSRYSDADPEERYRNLFAMRSAAEPTVVSQTVPNDLFVDLLGLARRMPATQRAGD